MKIRIQLRQIILPLVLLFTLTGFLQAQNQNIGGDLTGEPLLEYLRANYTPSSTLGYNIARDRMYTILDNHDGVVVCLYTYFEVEVDPDSSTPRADAYDNANGINAEHLWPQSKGAGSEPARSDLHSLYASEIRVNADRANYRFGNIPDEEVNLWYNKVNRENSDNIFTSTPPPVEERDEWSKLKSGDKFEAKLDRKGDIARAMFYFYTIYKDEADNNDPNYFYSMDEALLTWHDMDEVDDYEVWRTETISGWQGNVNPFVMDTTLVRRAYFPDDPATSNERNTGLPKAVTLGQNYPNPFNPATSISYNLPENQNVKIAIYDMLGREVTVLVNGTRAAGPHEVHWDASNFSSGIYLYSLETESVRFTRNMTLIK